MEWKEVEMAEVATPVEALETWQNVSNSRHVLKKISAGGVLRDEMINGKKKFHLTEQERRINSENAADERSDPFSNGRFVPVRLLEDSEDAAKIASNPNIVTEADMADLVKGSAPALKKKLEEISNPMVLGRLLEVAEENDAPVSKVSAIKERVAVVSPELAVEGSEL